MLKTRCKYKCHSVTKHEHWDSEKGFVYDAEFGVVTSGSQENEEFFAATPSGTLKVSTFKDDLFKPGKEYYLDIIPAD